MKKQLFVLGLLGLLSTYDTVLSMSADTSHPTAWEETVSTSDRALSQKILRVLTDDAKLAPEAMGIKIMVVNGNVTLRGTVSTQEIKKHIQTLAEETAGVVSVDNKLAVSK